MRMKNPKEVRIFWRDIFYWTNCTLGVKLDKLLSTKHSPSGDLLVTQRRVLCIRKLIQL